MVPKYSTNKLQAAWVSLIVTIVLVTIKLAVGLVTNSLALLSLAAESGIDLASVLITLLAVRISSIPPDADHPYGHGKFENLSALGQGVLLLAVSIWIVVTAVGRSAAGSSTVTVNSWSFGVLAVSIGLDLWRAQLLRTAGSEHHSAALSASSLHFFTDSLSAFIAAVALLLVWLAGAHSADSWAAIAVAVFVAYLSIRLSMEAIDGLTDRFTATGEYDRLRAILQNIPGVERVARMRMRTAGPGLFIEVSILVSRVLPLEAIERIVSETEGAIQDSFPRAEVTVHWRPVRTATEAPFDTLKIAAATFGLLPHNTELSRTKHGALALDYHLEFKPGTSLASASRASQEIEQRLRNDLPQVGPIFVHLEEERSDRAMPHLEEIERESLKQNVTLSAKAAHPAVHGIAALHIFRNEEDGSLKLVLTVDLPASLSLHEAHTIVTAVEAALRKEFPEFNRILIQAEPAT